MPNELEDHPPKAAQKNDVSRYSVSRYSVSGYSVSAWSTIVHIPKIQSMFLSISFLLLQTGPASISFDQSLASLGE